MKNIWAIFKGDVNRIRKNVIAMIVIVGITVVPSLYALSLIHISLTFWRIPILTNCGFRVVRKKKTYAIPDAAWERI